MNLVRYNKNLPRRSFNSIGGFFDDIFNSPLNDFFGGNYVSNVPSINILEKNDEVLELKKEIIYPKSMLKLID